LGKRKETLETDPHEQRFSGLTHWFLVLIDELKETFQEIFQKYFEQRPIGRTSRFNEGTSIHTSSNRNTL